MLPAAGLEGDGDLIAGSLGSRILRQWAGRHSTVTADSLLADGFYRVATTIIWEGSAIYKRRRRRARLLILGK